jgi:hypothetical protein
MRNSNKNPSPAAEFPVPPPSLAAAVSPVLTAQILPLTGNLAGGTAKDFDGQVSANFVVGGWYHVLIQTGAGAGKDLGLWRCVATNAANGPGVQRFSDWAATGLGLVQPA